MKRNPMLFGAWLSCLIMAGLAAYLQLGWEPFIAAAFVLSALVKREEWTAQDFIKKIELTDNSLLVLKLNSHHSYDELRAIDAQIKALSDKLSRKVPVLILDKSFSTVSAPTDKEMIDMGWVKQ